MTKDKVLLFFSARLVVMSPLRSALEQSFTELLLGLKLPSASPLVELDVFFVLCSYCCDVTSSFCTECEGDAADCDPSQTSRVWSSKPNK